MPRGREPLFVYEAGHGLGGDPPVTELVAVELVPGDAERKGRVNKSEGFGRAASSGDVVAV